jgi:hypothetical protein
MSQPFHPPIIGSSESLASGHTPVTAVRRRQRLPVTQNQAQPWVDSESRPGPGGARARAAAIAATMITRLPGPRPDVTHWHWHGTVTPY